MCSQLPVQSSSLSYWHRTTRSFPYLNANCYADVPSHTKYLIIGSGISGALTAWKLIESGVSGDDVLILEAREAVSGATGRNAGHIRPDAFRGFPTFAAIHGSEQAKKILENERDVLKNVKEFVTANNIDCDFRYTTTFEVCLSPEFADQQAQSIQAFQAAGGDTSHVKFYEGPKAKESTRVPNAIVAYEWPAASNHPGKLCQWILSDVVRKGARLWTHCPATKVVKHNGQGSTGPLWDVQTPRGIISAETIVHCTNGHAGVLLPELVDFLVPRRSQVHSFVPNHYFSGENFSKSTMSLRYGVHNFFSFNQLQDGTILLGGSGLRGTDDLTLEETRSLITFDDTGYSDTIARNSSREFSKLSSSSGPSTNPDRRGEGLDWVWTGILGMTSDSVPFVGPIEGLDGQWICAGFNGHGMARIFTCAPGLVKLMAGESWEATGLPECFRFTQERIKGFNKQKTRSQL